VGRLGIARGIKHDQMCLARSPPDSSYVIARVDFGPMRPRYHLARHAWAEVVATPRVMHVHWAPLTDVTSRKARRARLKTQSSGESNNKLNYACGVGATAPRSDVPLRSRRLGRTMREKWQIPNGSHMKCFFFGWLVVLASICRCHFGRSGSAERFLPGSTEGIEAKGRGICRNPGFARLPPAQLLRL
jgi:hypothetical protein